VELSGLLSLIPELQPFHSIRPIDDPTRNDTEDEELQSEFEDGEIVRIHDEESKVMRDEESKIKENTALGFVI
jgi:hypothetical protein